MSFPNEYFILHHFDSNNDCDLSCSYVAFTYTRNLKTEFSYQLNGFVDFFMLKITPFQSKIVAYSQLINSNFNILTSGHYSCFICVICFPKVDYSSYNNFPTTKIIYTTTHNIITSPITKILITRYFFGTDRNFQIFNR